ncbi:MAG: GntR family transcriptional regulator, partial [Actinobacteria bacterium]|nr:GntR family transcriptional regulator [Actinomycetota bacterium]
MVKMKIEELKPVIRTNLADIIMEQIVTLIKEGKLKVGKSFFSERQLAEQFNVSRVT